MVELGTATVQSGHEPAESAADARPEATAAIVQLARTHDLLQTEVGRLLRPAGLSAGSFAVLGALERAGGSLSPSRISKAIGVTRAGVTGLVDSLERRELVVRRDDPRDRRRTDVILTDAGRDMLATLEPELLRHEAELMSGLTARDLTSLRRLLARVAEHVIARDASAAGNRPGVPGIRFGAGRRAP